MFAKSKRFSETVKDHVPGPGEYEVAIDDTNRLKRYGFLNQTNRFPDTTESADLSSEASLSVSSVASDRKNSLVESFRKEIDILLSKTRKMELVIQSLEAEKKELKATLITKDLELAEQRSKNSILQKTIDRQEITSKATQLQKKSNQLQQALQSTQDTLAKREHTITILQTEIEQQQLAQQLDQQKNKSLEAQVATLSAHLSESQADATQRQMQLDKQQHDILIYTETNNTLTKQLEAFQQRVLELESQHHQLTVTMEAQQAHTQQLESDFKTKENIMSSQLEQKDRLIEDKTSLVERLVKQFSRYKQWIQEDVISYLRKQRDTARQEQSAELNRALGELFEAKKFVNKQALHLDQLKSDVYWLTQQNRQLHTLVQQMHDNHIDQIQFSLHLFSGTLHQLVLTPKKHRKRIVFKKKKLIEPPEDSDTSVSFTSHSDALYTLSNDSGFGVLPEEAKMTI